MGCIGTIINLGSVNKMKTENDIVFYIIVTIQILLIFILIFLFVSSCYGFGIESFEPICWQKAIYGAIVVSSNTNYKVRIVLGNLKGEYHSQAICKKKGKWYSIEVGNREVYLKPLKDINLEIFELFTINEYLKLMDEKWKK